MSMQAVCTLVIQPGHKAQLRGNAPGGLLGRLQVAE
jgi:hypothetical protein